MACRKDIHKFLEIFPPDGLIAETEARATGLSVDKMSSSVESTPHTVSARRPRWQNLCLILVTFNVLAVGIGLDLSHRLMTIYAESVRLNREWTKRLGSCSDLGQLAAAVHAPGNDVFDTNDFAAESAILDKATERFSEKMRELREETTSRLSVTETRTLLQQIDAAQDAMDEMSGEAKLIFSSIRDNQLNEAGEHKAAIFVGRAEP